MLFLTSCSKDGFTMFRDKGCVYMGKLKVDREDLSEYILSVKREDQTKIDYWVVTEREKETELGRYWCTYMPSKYLVNGGLCGAHDRLDLVAPIGEKIAEDKKILVAVGNGLVEYDETTEVLLKTLDVSKEVVVKVINATKVPLTNFKMHLNECYSGFDLYKSTADNLSSVLLNLNSFGLTFNGATETTKGYVFGFKTDPALRLAFNIEGRGQFSSTFSNIFRREGNSYLAEITITDDMLNQRVEEEVVIEGLSDIELSQRGEIVTITPRVILETRYFVNGELKEKKREPISFELVLSDDDKAISVSREGDTISVSASENTTGASRSRQITVTSRGVSKTIKATQKGGKKYIIDGEIL